MVQVHTGIHEAAEEEDYSEEVVTRPKMLSNWKMGMIDKYMKGRKVRKMKVNQECWV